MAKFKNLVGCTINNKKTVLILILKHSCFKDTSVFNTNIKNEKVK